MAEVDPTPSKYNDVDFALKETRTIGVRDDAVVEYFQKLYLDLGGPPVSTAAGTVKPIVVDGDFGTQTKNAVLKFQEACGIPRTGNLDDLTYFQADWRAYIGWVPCSTSVTNTANGGPAIVQGYNEVVRPRVRVDKGGLCRVSKRGTDVREFFAKRKLGTGQAVKRAARGQEFDIDGGSDHWFSIADDEMGDENANRVIEFSEIEFQLSLWNYMMLRAQRGPGYRKYILNLEYKGDTSTRDRSSRGMDLTSVAVIGNLKRANGQYMFPDKNAKRDVSWSAGRNSLNQLSGTVHTAPFHSHFSHCPVGAPEGSPFI